MLSPTEIEIVKLITKELESVYQLLINRDNDKIIEHLNTNDRTHFMTDNAGTFTVDKVNIRDAINLGNFVIRSEGIHKK